jgi:hypothetical protein
VLDLPETEEPPDVFQLPAAVHLGAAAAAQRSRPAACSPPSWPGSAGPTCRSRSRPSTPTASVTEATERSLSIVGRIEVSLTRIFLGQEQLCEVLDRASR